MKTNLAPLAVLALSALLISGCQVAPLQSAATTGVDQAREQNPEVPPEPPEPPVEIPIPDDSLFPLLRAEFLLRERQFDRALAILTEQALLLDDAALALSLIHISEPTRRS